MENHPYTSRNGFIDQLNMSSEDIQKWGFIDGGIWFNDTRSIVCGTFPPKKEYNNRKGYIHYSSPRNKFWQHIYGIYRTNLFINSADARDEGNRINNAIDKITFLKKMKLGFIDIFTSITRKDSDSSRDEDIIEPYKTFIDEQTFEKLLKSQVENIIFVYSKSYNVFIDELKKKYGNISKVLVREYDKNGITLRVEKIVIDNRILYLSYSPIHGNIKDYKRRPALKKAIENDFS